MSIDYDGINEAFHNAIRRSERYMLEALQEAFPDYHPPLTWQICGDCRGEGSNSRHLGVVDPDDWDDEDFCAYLEGRYNETCQACSGTGKVKQFDHSTAPPEIQDFIEGYMETAYQDAQVQRQERMMGA